MRKNANAWKTITTDSNHFPTNVAKDHNITMGKEIMPIVTMKDTTDHESKKEKREFYAISSKTTTTRTEYNRLRHDLRDHHRYQPRFEK